MQNDESTMFINYKKITHIWTVALESYANMKFFVIKGHFLKISSLHFLFNNNLKGCCEAKWVKKHERKS